MDLVEVIYSVIENNESVTRTMLRKECDTSWDTVKRYIELIMNIQSRIPLKLTAHMDATLVELDKDEKNHNT